MDILIEKLHKTVTCSFNVIVSCFHDFTEKLLGRFHHSNKTSNSFILQTGKWHIFLLTAYLFLVFFREILHIKLFNF